MPASLALKDTVKFGIYHVVSTMLGNECTTKNSTSLSGFSVHIWHYKKVLKGPSGSYYKELITALKINL